MIKPTHVLIIEEEPLVTFSIEEALRRVTEDKANIYYKPESYNSYEHAFCEAISTKPFGLAFINMDMESGDHEKLQYIKTMAGQLKHRNPKIQLLMLTSHQDNYMIIDAIKVLNPDAVLLKKDVVFNDLLSAVDSVVNHIPFYSKSILRMLRSRITSDISLDRRDRLILHHLSRGVRTKDLPKLVHLSNSGIEHRKRNLKKLFNVECKSDRFLLEEARQKGFI